MFPYVEYDATLHELPLIFSAAGLLRAISSGLAVWVAAIAVMHAVL